MISDSSFNVTMDPVLVVTTLTTTAHAFLSIFPEIQDSPPAFCMNWNDFLQDINSNIEVNFPDFPNFIDFPIFRLSPNFPEFPYFPDFLDFPDFPNFPDFLDFPESFDSADYLYFENSRFFRNFPNKPIFTIS